MPSGWFRLSNSRIQFTGIARPAFDAWLRTDEGNIVVARTGRDLRFTLMGRDRAARRALWKSLDAAFRPSSVAHAIQTEADRYLALLAGLAVADALPRVYVDLHRLVAVPRALVDNGIFASLLERLEQQPSVAALDRSIRLFAAARLVGEMDAALVNARPRVARPVLAWEHWVSVGLNAQVAWTLPLSSGVGERRGHFHVYEMPRGRLAWRARRKIGAAIQELDQAVNALSRAERVDIVGRLATQVT